MHTMQGNNNNAGAPLRPTDVAIGRVMKEAGYATGHVGKWAIADNLPEPVADAQSPWNQGFDFVAGNLRQGANGKWISNYLQFDRDASVTGEAPRPNAGGRSRRP
jgi:arylsulfatase A-like enzyme